MIRLRHARPAGSSLPEIGIAILVFLLVAGAITTALTGVVGTDASAQQRRVAQAELAAVLSLVTAAGYDYADDPSTVPGLPRCEDEASVCVSVGAHPQVPVDFEVERRRSRVGAARVDTAVVTASLRVPGGPLVSRSVTLVSPGDGLASGTHAAVRVVFDGEEPASAVLLDHATNAVVAITRVRDRSAVFTVSDGTCAPAAPCRLALHPALPYFEEGSVGLSAPAVRQRIEAHAGQVTDVRARTVAVSPVTIDVVAGPDLTPARDPGSVCLWIHLPDISAPMCNTGDPATIDATRVSLDPDRPELSVPVPAGRAWPLTVDRGDGTCPAVPGQVGHRASGWSELAVCTSHTWGHPSSFLTGGTTPGAGTPGADAVDAAYAHDYAPEVRAMTLQSDGKLVIGGSFASYGGAPRVRLARLNPNGTLDTGFAPSINQGRVWDVAVQADGRIVVAGEFSSVTGTNGVTYTRNNLVRLLADGNVDTTFSPSFNGTTPRVRTIALSGTDLYLGGNFTTVVGTAGTSVARTNLVRLDANGNVLTAFQANANGDVAVLVTTSSGLLVGGSYSSLVSGGVSYPRTNLARVALATGVPDTAIAPSISGGESTVVSLAVQSDGKIVLGGNFTTVAGSTRRGLARLNANGTFDATLSDINAANTVDSISLQPDGRFVISGAFLTLGPDSLPRKRLARLDSAGTIDPTFANLDSANRVFVVLRDSTGRLLLGGRMTTAQGTTTDGGLVAVTQNGLLDHTYPVIRPTPTTGTNALAVASMPDGRVVFGGNLGLNSPDEYWLLRRQRLARLAVNGTMDTAFTADVYGGDVLALLPQTDRILVGGAFTSAMSTSGTLTATQNRLVRFDTNGNLDSTWTATTNGTVTALSAVPSSTNVLVAGAFTSVTVSGTATTRSRIARLTTNGGIDTTFVPPTINSQIDALAVQPDGKVLIAGSFTSITSGATAFPYSRVARLNANGSLDTTFTNPAVNGTVNSIAYVPHSSGDRIVIGGSFTTVGGQPYGRLARLNTNGSLDAELQDPDVAGEVKALVVDADRSTIVGGDFTSVQGGIPMSRMARFDWSGTADLTYNPAVNAPVHALAPLAGGKLLVAGDFSSLGNGVSRVGVARLNGTSGAGALPSQTSFGEARLDPSVGRYTVVFDGDDARPAAGYDGELAWAKPRLAPACAETATCQPVALRRAPEGTECPGRHCRSAASTAPALTSPRCGTERVPCVLLASAVTSVAIPIDLIDPDDGTYTVRVSRSVSAGTLRVGTSSGPIASVNTQLGTFARDGRVILHYTNTSSATTLLERFELTLDDGTHTVVVPVAIYRGSPLWTVRPGVGVVTAAQGSTNTPVPYTLVGATGNPLNASASVVVTLLRPNGTVLDQTTQTLTGPTGTIGLNLASAPPAGRYTLRFAPTQSASAENVTTVAVEVTPTPATLSFTDAALSQGASHTVTVTSTDLSGANVGGVVVHYSVPDDSGLSLDRGRCVTSASGVCQVVVSAAADAPPGGPKLTVRSGVVEVERTITVSQTPARIQAPALKLPQGSSGQLVVTVTDAGGRPVAGRSVSAALAAPHAGLSVAASATTDGDGVARLAVQAAGGANLGEVKLALTAGQVNRTASVTVTGSPASLESSSGSVEVAIGQQVTLSVSVRDAADTLLSGTTVNARVIHDPTKPAPFRIDAVRRTGTDGIARFVLEAGIRPRDPHVVEFTSGNQTIQVTVTVVDPQA
jgi:uncharacterized delta-60 repeat protein